MEADFSGWATKAGLKCTDGVTILSGAFQHMDKKQVPLVWQHGHSNPENVLGHAILENLPEGVRAHAFFNDTKQGKNAKQLVQHGDIKALSIYANQIAKHGQNVVHGMIREVSLVLAGANPGALIDHVKISHGDGEYTDVEDEVVIHTGLNIEAQIISNIDDEEDDDEMAHEDKTVQEVYDTLTDEQKDVVHYLIGAALDSETDNADVKQSDVSSEKTADDSTKTGDDELAHKEGTGNMRNVFDQNDSKTADTAEKRHILSHADVQSIVKKARSGGSLKAAVEDYAIEHGITNIDLMFPDAQLMRDRPELNKRRTEWVAEVLGTTQHTPFAKVKTLVVDMTADEARAKGYVKGAYKLEEWIGVSRRTTSPTTIYKKQKLDRDDVLDITDFDIIAFLKEEMRIMLDEEVARAILIGDGRSVGAEDKVKDPIGAADGTGIRSIANDHELFATTLYVNVADASSNYEEVVDAVMDGMDFYKGSGTPVFFTTLKRLNMFKKAKDLNGQRYYKTTAEVAEALGVSKIVTVDPMAEVTDLIGIIVNLGDYNIGTNKGGEVNYFDQFDIDYNQQKYLMETRLSGALSRIKSALVVRETAAANVLVAPQKPTFVPSTGVVTIPTQTGVVYKNFDTNATLTAGPQAALTAGSTLNVIAVASAGYYFADNASDQWPFKRPA